MKYRDDDIIKRENYGFYVFNNELKVYAGIINNDSIYIPTLSKTITKLDATNILVKDSKNLRSDKYWIVDVLYDEDTSEEYNYYYICYYSDKIDNERICKYKTFKDDSCTYKMLLENETLINKSIKKYLINNVKNDVVKKLKGDFVMFKKNKTNKEKIEEYYINKYDKYLYKGNSLDEVIKILVEARENNKKIFINFKGFDIYSSEVHFFEDGSTDIEITSDIIYRKVYGMDKNEYYQHLKQEKEEKKQYAKSRISEWVELGQQYIDEERFFEWERFVKDNAVFFVLNYENAMDTGIEIMASLKYKNYSLTQFKALLKTSDFQNRGVKQILEKFSPEYNEYLEMVKKEEQEEKQKEEDTNTKE